MKELKENLNYSEEGEELIEIDNYNVSDEIQKFKHNKSIHLKRIFKIICIIIILVFVLIFLIYLFKIPSKEEKYNECQWFVDGKSYFEDLFQKLMEAKNSIYITDWWLSPEVFLRRPVDVTPYLEMVKNKLIINNQEQNITRLMDVLNYKAKQGVQIYILIYN